jgi:hypothetical protein
MTMHAASYTKFAMTLSLGQEWSRTTGSTALRGVDGDVRIDARPFQAGVQDPKGTAAPDE